MNIRIQEPWWGAWKRFGWAKGIWGVSFSKKVVDKAIKDKEKLFVHIWKFKTRYIISPVTVKNYAQKNNTENKARHNTILYCVPQTLLKKEKNLTTE